MGGRNTRLSSSSRSLLLTRGSYLEGQAEEALLEPAEWLRSGAPGGEKEAALAPLWENFLVQTAAGFHNQLMPKTLRLKPLPVEILEQIEPAPLSWGRLMSLEQLPGGLAVLTLPGDRLEFDESRGFWPHVAACQDPQGQPLLLINLNSFDLENGPGQSWAIPLGPPPNQQHRLLRELGFGEGWEMSYPETLLSLPGEWAPLVEKMRQGAMLGVSVEGAQSIYPMRFQPEALEQMDLFLKASS